MSTFEKGFEEGYETGLGDEISKAFRDGTWAQRTQPQPVVRKLLNAPEGAPAIETATQQARNIFIESVIGPFFSDDRSNVSRSQSEIDFFDFYCEKRNKSIFSLSLHYNFQSQIYLEAVKGTNIADVHKYTELQYDKFSRERGKQLIGSKEYVRLSKEIAFWSRAEEIAKGAVEHKLLNRLSED